MQLKGINNKQVNESVADALKKSGYKLLEKRVSWPRMRGNGTMLIDCGKSAVKNALFVVR